MFLNKSLLKNNEQLEVHVVYGPQYICIRLSAVALLFFSLFFNATKNKSKMQASEFEDDDYQYDDDNASMVYKLFFSSRSNRPSNYLFEVYLNNSFNAIIFL